MFKKNLHPVINKAFDFVLATRDVATSVVHIVCWDDDMLSNGIFLLILRIRITGADLMGEAFVAVDSADAATSHESRLAIFRGTGPVGLARAIEQMIIQRDDKVASSFIADRKKWK